MTNYNENGIMIKISHFIETVLLLICLSRHAKCPGNIIIHDYKYKSMLTTVFFSSTWLIALHIYCSVNKVSTETSYDCPKISQQRI